MKQKIKKELKPNEFGVLLEQIDSNIKLIVENHLGLDKRINTLDQKIDRNYQEMNSSFKTVLAYLCKVDDEIQSIKSELTEIKSQLKNKANLSFVGTLEKRVNKLETNYNKLNSLILQQCA